MISLMTERKDLTASFTSFLRSKSKRSCPLEDCPAQVPDTDERIRAHLLERHADFLDGKNISDVIAQHRNRDRGKEAQKQAGAVQQGQYNESTTAQTSPLKHDDTSEATPNKPVKSSARNRSSSPPRRSRAKHSSPAYDPAFTPRPQQAGKLWSPDDLQSVPPKVNSLNNSKKDQPRHHQRPADHDVPDADEPFTLIRQPETRQISQEQLVAEVKGIYAGLVMVESKCIEVDNAQSSQNDAKLNNEQWQALIALHRTLLHEHHDFFLASQHPSASPALRRLASKYAMPARMWRHGIHSFLELLRHRLPASLEHMLTFIYLAYSMMALLYETVPAFEDTWIECLGDLGRYRMAIEDDDIRDREVWTSVSRHWYSKASDKAPTTGRLYHHLAILARPNALQQLFYYTKSLCVPIPFGSARESIMTLFDPILNAGSTQHSRLLPIDAAFVKAHGILFSDKSLDQFLPAVREFLDNLNNHVARTTRRWLESGYYIAISNCCSTLGYGREGNAILKAIRPSRGDETAADLASVGDEQKLRTSLGQALLLVQGTHEVVFHRVADPCVLPYVHVVLVFMDHLTFYPTAMSFVDSEFPWKLVSLFLNTLLTYGDYPRIQSSQFPRPEKGLVRPLPEDFAMKGLLWVDKYFPNDWFSNEKIDDDEKYFEVASMTDERRERIIWLACRIAKHNKWLMFDETQHKFGVLPQFEKDIEITLQEAELTNLFDTVSRTSTTGTGEKTPSTLADKEDEEMMDIDDAEAPTVLRPTIQR